MAATGTTIDCNGVAGTEAEGHESVKGLRGGEAAGHVTSKSLTGGHWYMTEDSCTTSGAPGTYTGGAMRQRTDVGLTDREGGRCR
eukprot:CAMPEP_0172686854 /NCGR_PEP_ID=MMETSP1074-20121228/21233_1 /TAXON_ID=2916 /ORGANISM="Ceratium fusus, Strain PA161109" /LENGTH=84 /DNA_ID=CAMNT_0013506217 /DNA_START=1210 /DNA_END=1461 /DNA_ORIENTATION=-